MAYSSSILLHNCSEAAMSVWIEPWGDMIEVPAGAALRVVAEAADPGALEIDVGGERGEPAVWAWNGASLRCYVGEAEVRPGAYG